MKNKKGFTLVELMAVIVVLAILIAIAVPTYDKIKRSIDRKNYENKVSLIKVAAAKFAEDTNITATFVKELIEQGYLQADDDEGHIYGIDKDYNKIILDCYVVLSERKDGLFYSDFIDKDYSDSSEGNESVCDYNIPNKLTTDFKIEMYDGSLNNTLEYNDDKKWWTKNNVILKTIFANGENNEVTWYEGYGEEEIAKCTGGENNVCVDTSDSKILYVNSNSVLQQNYTAKSTDKDGNPVIARVRVYIDKLAPSFYQNHADKINDKWSSSTIDYKVSAYDNESGLYGFNDGTIEGQECPTDFSEYKRSKKISFNSNGKKHVCLIDNVGNTNDTTFEVTHIDTLSPTCSIIVGREKDFSYKNSDWYSNDVSIKVSYSDTYEDETGKIVDSTANVISKKLTIKNGENTTKVDDFNNLQAAATININGTNEISATIKDQAGNTVICSKTINMDNVTPSIVSKNSEEKVKYAKDQSVLNYFEIKKDFGITGGTTTCYKNAKSDTNKISNNNTLGLGINLITCEMTGNNGKTSTASTIIKHNSSTETFTCKDSFYQSGTDCKKGTNKCLEWNTKTDASCGCKTFKCKTYKTTTETYCSKYKKCIDTCPADNGGSYSSYDRTKGKDDKMHNKKTLNNGCKAQTGTISTSVNHKKNTVTITWNYFALVHHGLSGGGTLCYVGNINNSIKVGSGTISCSSSNGQDNANSTGQKMGYESGNNQIFANERVGICSNATNSEKNSYPFYNDKDSKNICSNGCVLKFSKTIDANQLTEGKRNYILLGGGKFLEAYHSICTPTFVRAEKCGCAKEATKEVTTNECKTNYSAADGINSTTCSEYNTCNSTCKKYDITTDNSKKAYYLSGTDYRTNTPINATCDAKGNCQF